MDKTTKDFLTAMKTRITQQSTVEFNKYVSEKVMKNLQVMVQNGAISSKDAEEFARSEGISFDTVSPMITKRRTTTKNADATSCGGSHSRCSCSTN